MRKAVWFMETNGRVKRRLMNQANTVDKSMASATPTINVIDMPSAATWISLIVR